MTAKTQQACVFNNVCIKSTEFIFLTFFFSFLKFDFPGFSRIEAGSTTVVPTRRIVAFDGTARKKTDQSLIVQEKFLSLIEGEGGGGGCIRTMPYNFLYMA